MTTEVIPNGGGEGAGDGSPEGHIEKMLKMGDGTGVVAPKEGEEGYVAPGDQVTARPDDIPEQFWDAEKGEVNTAALLKSQADGQTEINKLRGKKPEGEQTDDEKAAAKAAADAAAANPKVVEDASAEYAEKGELSDETFASLDKAGISKEMVNAYIAGQTAIVSSLQEAAYGPFEGAEGYDAAANWAAEKFTDDEVKALDVQLLSNNPAIVAQGAKALAARYAAEADVEPNTIRGDGNTNAAGGKYLSSREMMKDMNSAKYRTSEAFRNEVAQKLARSSL